MLGGNPCLLMDFLHHMVDELCKRTLKWSHHQPTPWNYNILQTATAKNQKSLLSSTLFLTDPTDPDQFLENPAFPIPLFHGHAQYLQGAVIEQIQQVENDRILEIAVSTKMNWDDISVTLIIEIMGKHSNIILLTRQLEKNYRSNQTCWLSQIATRPFLPGLDPFSSSKNRCGQPFLQSRISYYSPSPPGRVDT